MFEHDTPDNVSFNEQSSVGALPCDAWHHYYHYQSSAQYLWLAETCRALGLPGEAKEAYTRAIFQDHFNQEALAGVKELSASLPPRSTRGRDGVGAYGGAKQETPTLVLPLAEGGGNIKYNKHPPFDLEFLSLIGELPDDATRLHDEAAVLMQESFVILSTAKDLMQTEPDPSRTLRMTNAKTLLDHAIALSPHHSNSHFGRGKCRFLTKQFEAARDDFKEAIRLSHRKHDAYHRTASAEHLARGRIFLKRDELDLAVSDFTKALDLYRSNKEALKARAEAYRIKGSVKLAQEDEEKLNTLHQGH